MTRSRGFYNWAWDPIEGCKRDCWYCYGKREFTELGKDFSKVQFFEERLIEPSEVKPSRIFVNHWCDIMAEWTPKKWVNEVIDVCKSLPKHEFIFLTKSPEGYLNYDFPGNCILGVSIEGPDQWSRANIMKAVRGRQMCSCEPILGSFKGYDFSQFEFVVIGELDGNGNYKNYRTVRHKKIYYKR